MALERRVKEENFALLNFRYSDSTKFQPSSLIKAGGNLFRSPSGTLHKGSSQKKSEAKERTPKTQPPSRASHRISESRNLGRDKSKEELMTLIDVLESDLRNSRKIKDDDRRCNQEFLSAVWGKHKKLEGLIDSFCEH